MRGDQQIVTSVSTRKIQRNRSEDQRSRSRGCPGLWRACAGADLGGVGGDEINGRPPQTSSRGKRVADWRLSDGEDEGMGSSRPLGLSKGRCFYTSLWVWAIYSLLGRFCPTLMRSAHEFGDYPRIEDGEPGNVCVPALPDGICFGLLSSPRGVKSPHLHPLMDEFPVRDRGSGPHCHP
jgi:hypothetical protein